MPRTTLVTRIEANLKTQIGEVAKKQNRTTSNLVEWLLKQYLSQVTQSPIAKHDGAIWDSKIALDAEAGKLDFLLNAAQGDYDAGKLQFK